MKIVCKHVEPQLAYDYAYGDGDVCVGEFRLCHVNESPWWSLWNVEVYPPYRGLGHGSEMLKLSLDEIRAKGGTQAFLFVKADNEVAIKLYEKFGFKVGHTSRMLSDHRMEVKL